MWFFPMGYSNERVLLVINHEFGSNGHVLGKSLPDSFSGPVAGSPLLENPAGNAPMGTLNNCANGYTPWGALRADEQ